MEVTGKNQDECMVALHDCNEDVSKAINFLLESSSDMVIIFIFKSTFLFVTIYFYLYIGILNFFLLYDTYFFII